MTTFHKNSDSSLNHTPKTFKFFKIAVWGMMALFYKVQSVKIGKGACISPFVHFSGKKQISIGEQTIIHSGARIKCNKGKSIIIGNRCIIHNHALIMSYGGRIDIGSDVSINPFSVIYGHGDLRIGNKVRVATHVVIIPGNHNYESRNIPIMDQGVTGKKIVIHDDVWIAAGSIILGGITIGKGAVVAAGSVVTKDVAPYSVVAGTPARLIKWRSNE